MTPAEHEAVVFDLGGVLLDWSPTHLLAADDVVALDIDGVQRELDLGRPVEQVRAHWRTAHPGRTASLDRYFDEWHRTVAGPIDDVVAILTELRETPVGLYALSNFSGELFRQARPRFAFLEWFDGMVISGDEGVVKPDTRIYQVLVDRFGLTPSRTVFIDDREDNVAAARAAGLVGIHFRSADELRTALRRLDLL
ncbi:MAG TPA: HAD family phosphatase [Euzebyales bacterium]|nr:HAD family phosphatase [Euzebyales bacterium]